MLLLPPPPPPPPEFEEELLLLKLPPAPPEDEELLWLDEKLALGPENRRGPPPDGPGLRRNRLSFPVTPGSNFPAFSLPVLARKYSRSTTSGTRTIGGKSLCRPTCGLR